MNRRGIRIHLRGSKIAKRYLMSRNALSSEEVADQILVRHLIDQHTSFKGDCDLIQARYRTFIGDVAKHPNLSPADKAGLMKSIEWPELEKGLEQKALLNLEIVEAHFSHHTDKYRFVYNCYSCGHPLLKPSLKKIMIDAGIKSASEWTPASSNTISETSNLRFRSLLSLAKNLSDVLEKEVNRIAQRDHTVYPPHWIKSAIVHGFDVADIFEVSDSDSSSDDSYEYYDSYNSYNSM